MKNEVNSLQKRSDRDGIVIVEVCDANAITSLDIESILEEEFPEVAVLVNDCLSFCGLCRVKPYAIVNNKRVFADTPEQCLDKIRKQIKEELAKYE
ncbi:DUF1450 domain-containing protein [Cerasibacillus terrae]|uniref:DUF1450 domain-containing protein n=1 Tax=Cerasibacillus terrae TaxID=2498845 RepID=A0A5C8P0N0_9BACI|nr:DUF1450 domain-containing protein [Cerasibacillus terrae]TXL66857.1 DUF1450 domain-containing protein [Cerasibacillus terrae]